MRKINTELKRRLRAKFSTQGDFSAKAKVNESILSRIINGFKKPTEEQKIKWSKLLDCKPEELFK